MDRYNFFIEFFEQDNQLFLSFVKTLKKKTGENPLKLREACFVKDEEGYPISLAVGPSSPKELLASLEVYTVALKAQLEKEEVMKRLQEEEEAAKALLEEEINNKGI